MNLSFISPELERTVICFNTHGEDSPYNAKILDNVCTVKYNNQYEEYGKAVCLWKKGYK